MSAYEEMARQIEEDVQREAPKVTTWRDFVLPVSITLAAAIIAFSILISVGA